MRGAPFFVFSSKSIVECAPDADRYNETCRGVRERERIGKRLGVGSCASVNPIGMFSPFPITERLLGAIHLRSLCQLRANSKSPFGFEALGWKRWKRIPRRRSSASTRSVTS